MTAIRPEDAANQQYYNHDIQWVKRRVTLDVEVEWRPDYPEYSDRVLTVEFMNTIRMRVERVVSIEVRGVSHEH